MKLTLKRIYTCSTYTIGHLYADGEYLCDTLEDCDRGLTDKMTVEEISKKKVYGQTAIPKGNYEIDMDTASPSFGRKEPYKTLCKGKVPRLKKVKGYSGVLIHVGNYPKDTLGCILVGLNKAKGQVLQSRATFEKVYKVLAEAHSKGEKITLEIS